MKGKLTTGLPKTRTYEKSKSKELGAQETDVVLSAANEEVFIQVPTSLPQIKLQQSEVPKVNSRRRYSLERSDERIEAPYEASNNQSSACDVVEPNEHMYEESSQEHKVKDTKRRDEQRYQSYDLNLKKQVLSGNILDRLIQQNGTPQSDQSTVRATMKTANRFEFLKSSIPDNMILQIQNKRVMGLMTLTELKNILSM